MKFGSDVLENLASKYLVASDALRESDTPILSTLGVIVAGQAVLFSYLAECEKRNKEATDEFNTELARMMTTVGEA